MTFRPDPKPEPEPKRPRAYGSTLPRRKAPLAHGKAPNAPRKAPARRTPIRKSNPKRKAANFARSFVSEARVLFVQSLPCAVPGCRRRDIQNAHIGSQVEAGMGRRGNADTIAPLCKTHHEMQEGKRPEDADRALGLPPGTLERAAAQTEAAWQNLNRPDR